MYADKQPQEICELLHIAGCKEILVNILKKLHLLSIIVRALNYCYGLCIGNWEFEMVMGKMVKYIKFVHFLKLIQVDDLRSTLNTESIYKEDERVVELSESVPGRVGCALLGDTLQQVEGLLEHLEQEVFELSRYAVL